MAEGGFDPCQCVFSHEGAMRRLISLLRSSQAYCSNEECFETLPGPSVSQTGSDDNTFAMVAMGWAVIALLLFFMRPTSFFARGDRKPSNNNQGPSQPPPDNSVQ